MNTILKTAIVGVAAAALLSGCAVRPTAGALFTNVKQPVTATSASEGSKVGISDSCTSILGLIATGDCGVESAKKNGGITSVTSVDYKSNNILGIIHTGHTVVTGN
ncbi:TRL-like family protein [Sulfurimonas sp.]